MHMALPSDNWLEQNALFCNRFHARLAPGACVCNREGKAAQHCAGCNGLEDHQRELPRSEPVIFFSEPDPEELDPLSRAFVAALQGILDCDEWEVLIEEPEYYPDANLAKVELNGFYHNLLSLLEDDQEESEEPRPVPEKKGPRRFAVFMGRCTRCSGWMVNAPEFYDAIRDEAVYRCYSCGYRSSPSYKWNRSQSVEGR